jgi:hypothetical protein
MTLPMNLKLSDAELTRHDELSERLTATEQRLLAKFYECDRQLVAAIQEYNDTVTTALAHVAQVTARLRNEVHAAPAVWRASKSGRNTEFLVKQWENFTLPRVELRRPGDFSLFLQWRWNTAEALEELPLDLGW